MTVQLSSRFESRDMLELALMRLRQSGIAFSVSNIASTPGKGGVTDETTGFFTSYLASNQLGIAGCGFPGVFEEEWRDLAHAAGEVLTIKLRAEHLELAKEILLSANSKDVKVVV